MTRVKKSIEIEIQVQIERTKNLIDFLKKNGRFSGKLHQIDTYYIPSHRNFTKKRPLKEWLRLRNSSDKQSINYKNWHFDKNGRSSYCDEFETPIENLEQMEKIFKALNIKKVAVVDKTRKVWNFKEYEIALDNIKGLGNFVEVEYKGKHVRTNPSQITKDMIFFLKKLDVGEISRNYVGYPFQLLFPKEVKYEKF